MRLATIFGAFILTCVRPLDGLCSKHCRTQITVDSGTQNACDNSTGSLSNLTCSSLENVLTNVMEGKTVHEAGGCIAVTIFPGSYVVTKRVTITQNVVVCGAQGGPASVSFQLVGDSQRTATNSTAPLQQYHAIRFQNASLTEISDIAFNSSAGVIVMQNVTVASVASCSFSFFYQGALDLYDCANVTVTNCTFANNGPVAVVKADPYRGHAGGLSLGYYYISSSPPVAKVSKCMFTNNTSSPPSYDQQTTSQLLQYLKFTGRGGGSSVLMGASVDVNVVYEDCVFTDNYAASYGGGLYSGYSGNHDNTLVVNGTRFVRNSTPGGGGGLELGFASGMFPNSVTSVYVYSCVFSENEAGVGGGIYVFAPGPTAATGKLSNFVHLEGSTFIGNMADHYGAAVGMISMLTFNSRDRIRPMEIKDCTFAYNNGGLGGSMSTVYLPQVFSGRNVFIGNRGRTMVVVGTLVKIQGTSSMTFMNNDIATDGNALYLTSLGQLQISAGCSFSFQGNKGILGAAIAVDINYLPLSFQKTVGNTLCPFIYSNRTTVPSHWYGVQMNFSDNHALVGPAVYMNALDVCSWSQSKEPWFNVSGVFRWSFINYGLNYDRAHSSTDPMWFVETPVESLSLTTKMIQAYPGQVVNLVVKATDELGRATASTVRIQDLEDPPFLQFAPSALTHDNLNNPYISTMLYTQGNTTLTGEKMAVAEPILIDSPSTGDQFQVSLSLCPPGYTLSYSSTSNLGVCTCNSQNQVILACNETKIYLQSGLWGGLRNGSEDRLVTYPCPAGYCQCSPSSEMGEQTGTPTCEVVFDSSNPNAQCVCGREGTLCGECVNGSSFSALLNRCKTCPPAWAAVIPALVILDIVVFVVILVMEKPFPGWLCSLLFYIQLLPYLTEHFPMSFDQIHPYLYYVSSAFSFYFVYDFCLYISSNALVSYFLRFIPVILAIVVVTSVLQIKSLRNPYHGVWWITILTYTHTVHTCMSIFNCPSLPAQDGSPAHLWFVSAGTHCFEGWYLALGIVAIMVLGLCVSMIPLPLVFHVRKLQHPHWLYRCVEATSHTFKDDWKWWGSVELCRRLMVLLFTVPFPRNEFPAIFVIVIFGAVTLFVQPYRHWTHLLVEVVLLSDVSILVFIRTTQNIQETFQTVYFTTGFDGCHSTTLSFLAKFLAVFYYIPLLVALVSLLAWVAVQIRSTSLGKKWSLKKRGNSLLDDEVAQRSLSIDIPTKIVSIVGTQDGRTCASVQYINHSET